MKACGRPLSATANVLLCSLGMLWFTAIAWGNTEYYRHVVFDNSLTPDAYFYSQGSANGSSLLELKDHRLPVEMKTFLTPPNALRLQWQSQPGGGWEGEIRVVGFRRYGDGRAGGVGRNDSGATLAARPPWRSPVQLV